MVAGFLAAVPGRALAKDERKAKDKDAVVAPEISPVGAGAIIALLVGGTALLSTRRRKVS
jgi:hypothetical protein